MNSNIENTNKRKLWSLIPWWTIPPTLSVCLNEMHIHTSGRNISGLSFKDKETIESYV